LAEESVLASATGRRKTSIARVSLKLGTGQIVVNGKEMGEYFPRLVDQLAARQAFEITNTATRYDVIAKIHGGGMTGQAGALRHGIARGLEKLDPSQRVALRRAGYLTRDARKVERKKYGQKGARARFQFSKR
jgi:small subunit ribosomal protein S9